jgi:hypothetical protein
MLPLMDTGSGGAQFAFAGGALPPGWTFTRASKAYYLDATSALVSAATDVPASGPDGTGWGIALWQSIQNGIRNPRFEGGIAIPLPDGPELVTNGDFALNPVNAAQNTVQNGWQWSKVGGTSSLTWADGAVTLLGDGTNNISMDTSFTTVVGNIYVISADIGTNAVQTLAGTSRGASNLVSSTLPIGTASRLQFTATTTTTWLRFARTAAVSTTLDNVSVRGYQELLTNGDFASNPISATPDTIQNGWQWAVNGGTGTVTWNGSAVSLLGDGTNAAVFDTSISTVVGTTYALTADVVTSAVGVSVGNSRGGTNFYNNAISIVALTQRWIFVATATTTWVRFQKTSATTTTVDNVSVRTAVDLVTNGDFTQNPVSASQNTIQSGWQWVRAAGTSSVTWASGVVTMTGDGTNSVSFDTTIPTSVGAVYLVSADVGTNAITLLVGTTRGASDITSQSIAVGTASKITFKAGSTTTHLRFQRAAATTTTLDNFSIRSLGKSPTNYDPAPSTGLFREIVGFGAESGIPYVDIRIFGTAGSTGPMAMTWDTVGAIAAAQNQTWTATQFLRVVAGSTANITSIMTRQYEYNSGGTYLTEAGTVCAPTTDPLATQRYSAKVTLSNAATAYVGAGTRLGFTNGGAVDVTLRLGATGLSQVPFVPPIILPDAGTPAAATRAADNLTAANLPMLNSSEGTAFIDFNVGATGAAPEYILDIYADANNRIAHRILTGVSQLQTSPVVASSTQTSTTTQNVTFGSSQRSAVLWSAGNIGQGLNGTVVNANSTLPTDLTTCRIGSAANAGSYLNGFAARFALYRSRYPDATAAAFCNYGRALP